MEEITAALVFILLVGLPILNAILIVYLLWTKRINFLHALVIVTAALLIPYSILELSPQTSFGRIGISFITFISVAASFFVINLIAFIFLLSRRNRSNLSGESEIIDRPLSK